MDMFMAEMEGGSASLGTPGEHGKDIFSTASQINMKGYNLDMKYGRVGVALIGIFPFENWVGSVPPLQPNKRNRMVA
jgi:hypothetical protein